VSGENRAGEAWSLLLEIAAADRARRPAISAELGISAAQAEVLECLEPDRPTAMCRVAERLGCDPSNVTGIVGRLEARGLVERRPDPADRRIRNLVLTDAGRHLRARLAARLAEPPALLARLSAADREALCSIRRRLVTAHGVGTRLGGRRRASPDGGGT
jgi:DNA-binding MarR family transcriptional regulator